MKEAKSCCSPQTGPKPKGFWQGLLYGLLPHTFCILFILFSVIGSTVGAAFASRFLKIPYFFQFLIFMSFVFALISAVIYLKRLCRLNWPGIKMSWKYLSILFGSTLAINLVLFLGIFPAIANVNNGEAVATDSVLTIQVALPCPGHAPLITQDLLTQPGVSAVKFVLYDKFVINYNPQKVTVDLILGRKIFSEFKAKAMSNN